ncbi:uncharacterized protein BXZ73DRAFT_98081 [Epithele typhae]|uniref:uncharacterized protein n=1 Tax=Epithele typhae TaxID=378194 RepID=UPI00200857F7|nr:uncharacterized protein BXZ73DRAFT_98081 [Epithele typhae]KAH9941691.1 hypothetical protein BXZ73DRAFT_98081 [Epithele typhae]
MGSQIALSALHNQWAVVGVITVVSYDYFLTFDREIKYIWRRKMTSGSVIYIAGRYSSLTINVLTLLNFFPWPGKSTLKYALLFRASAPRANTDLRYRPAVFSSLRAHALCQRKLISYLVLALGVWNAVPSVYGAVKTRASYNPGPGNINTMCNVDVSQFTTFRNALLLVNAMNLAFINNIQLSLDFIGALSATAAVLTSRFILDLFEASTRTRFGTGPTMRLSAMPSMVLSRSLASRHVGDPGASGSSQGIFDADVSWCRTEDSESVYCTTDDYDFELQPVNLERQKSNVNPLVSES